MKVVFDPIWSWPVVLLAAFAALAGALMLYRRQLIHLEPPRRRVLIALRVFSWSVLAFLMCRPAIEHTEIDKRSAVFMVAVDSSRSMTVPDGPAGVTRRSAALGALAAVQPELEALAEEIDVEQFDFDKELIPVETRSPDARGEQTALGSVLDDVAKRSQRKRIAGLLLLSDGAQRALPPYDLDPRAAARQLADAQTPVHTVAFGASGLTESAIDLIAEDLQVSPVVFEKNTVVVTAKIRALGAAGRDIVVRLLLEDPAVGEPAPMKPAAPPLKLQTAQNQDVLPVEMSLTPQRAGEYRLTLEAVPLEGEPVVSNNAVSTFITVQKGGVNVAYFDAVRPEQKFIRLINESPDIQLDFKPVRANLAGKWQPPEPEWFTPGRYDVYIIGDVPAAYFGSDLLRRLAAAVDKGAGLMMTAGFHSFGPGGYARTPLADLLPVEMRADEALADGARDTARHDVTPVQMLPAAAGLQDFVMRLEGPAKNLDAWKSLAPLAGADKFTGLKPVARVLAETPEKTPLLVAQDVGRARCMAFAADTTFQWVLGGHEDLHQRFWQQVILWLAHKDVQGDQSVWLRLDQRRFRPGQPVEMTFGARDADKRPVEDAAFTIEVAGPKDEKQPLLPQRAGSENVARFINTQTPGEYRVRVEARQNGKLLGFGAQARFLVYEQDLELHNPAADAALLDEISRITGGAHVPSEQLAEFLRKLRRQRINPEISKTRTAPLWDNGLVAMLFVLGLSCEWWLRKKYGLV